MKIKEKPILLDNSYLNGSEIYFVRSKIDAFYPLHFHEFYEIELPISGEGYELINSNKYEIKTNQLFIFHQTDYHEIYATKPITMYNIAFSPQSLEERIMTIFLEHNGEIVITLSEEKLAYITDIIKLIEKTFYSSSVNKDIILSNLLNAFLLSSMEENNKINFSNSITLDILKYIHNNFSKNPSLQDLSDFCGYQKNYLCDYFKKNIGETYNDYLTKVKIEHSKKLLKTTNKFIKEIAIESGFNSVNNYIRNFKAVTKQTPFQYRKLYLNVKNNKN